MTATIPTSIDPSLLRETLERSYSGSAFLRAKLDAAGVVPRSIADASDLTRLPFTTKADVRDTPLADYTAVPLTEVARVHSSSGTTGRRTVCAYTRDDIENWTKMFARCYSYADVGVGDRVQIAVGYGMWTAGVGFQAGAERAGALAVPTGPGNTDLQVEMLQTMGSTVLGATSSFALLLAELIEARGLTGQLALRTGILGSERWGERVRSAIESRLGITTYDIYGLTELWGPGAGIECTQHDGIHIWTDHYHLEVVDPETLAPVPAGTLGEAVVTTLTKQATPLIRYRTRDLTYLYAEPCPCGSPYPRIARLQGRSDDQVKVRGVIFLPAQVDMVLAETPGCGSEFQAYIDRGADGRDTVSVAVEADDRPGLREELAHRLRNKIGLRLDVQIVPFATLPRSERKTRRVFDRRQY